MKINIKPLSVNRAYQGKRYRTPEYNAYEAELYYQLPNIEIEDKQPLELKIIAGMNTLQDIDGMLKCFIDVLQKKLGFNDRWVYHLDVTKIPVKKGEEFIDFEINPLSPS